ncbi:efflux RND transporter periplasmic adaptor subunit [bacterium]|nr:efflux RND transporter periplasmic adaptor subunit [bacterium]
MQQHVMLCARNRWGCVIVLGCLLAGCFEGNQYQAPPPVEVDVAEPLVRDVTIYLEETGTTEAVEKVEIQSRVDGVLEQVLFEPNDEVELNQVLFVIEQRRYKALRDSAAAELEARKVEMQKAEIEYARQKELFEKKATPETNLVAAKAELDGSKAAVLGAEASLDEAELNLEYTEVRSPIKGRIGKSFVKKGNLVTGTPGTHLATVISYDNIYANFSISEREYLTQKDQAKQQEKEAVPLYLARATDSSFPFKGTLNFTDLAVDESTGTFAVRGIFPNPGLEIVPGLFVRIRAPIDVSKDALLVPDEATGFDQAGHYLLVVNGQNKVERRNIELGNKFGPFVVVLKGLKAGERVIVEGVQRSRPEAIVAPKEIKLDVDESLFNAMSPQEAPSQEQPAKKDADNDEAAPADSQSPAS